MAGSPFDDLFTNALAQLRAEALRRRSAESVRPPRQCGQPKSGSSNPGTRKPKTHKPKGR